MNTTSQNYNIDENQYIHMDGQESLQNNNHDLFCCKQKIDMCIVTYFKYLFYLSLLLTNICNIVLNYKILNK